MIIECTSCKARYQYDEGRFERKPSKKIRCAKCQEVFEILNPAFAAAPKVDPGEDTHMGRPRTIEEAIPQMASLEDLSADSKQSATSQPGSSPGSVVKLPIGKRLSLAIINGPNSGVVFRMEKPRVVIGRSSGDFILQDSESSRSHAVVEARDPLVILEDLGSTNGTLVDGARIQRPVEIQNHSEFQIGTTTIMLIVTDEG